MDSATLEHQSCSEHQPVMARCEWENRRAQHIARVGSWATERQQRGAKAEWNPVYDFLFDYYSYRPSHLMRWSPGCDVILENSTPDELDWPDDFIKTDEGCVIPALSFPEHRRDYVTWAIKYLQGIADRPPSFCCFGLHEWAMVYQCEKPRHSRVPLRLSGAEVNRIVENADLRCTHYDAFRFFTPPAAPRNRSLLTRESTSDVDQRGCIHVTMDLYKFAHKIAPWCSSDLIADCFMLAADARQVDMRASPYDLRTYGFTAIEIEHAHGREEYIQEQRRLAESAVPVRTRLIREYEQLRAGWLKSASA